MRGAVAAGVMVAVAVASGTSTAAVAAPAETGSPALMTPATAASPALPTDGQESSWTGPAGTTSSYHLVTSQVQGQVKGLVVYLDGDGMAGADPDGYVLDGAQGVVEQAGSRGYATLSVVSPDPSRTFWENGSGPGNAAYVAALTRKVAADVGASETWFVGYSGGSQLISKYLLPGHGGQFATGGALMTGGGGVPPRGSAGEVPSSFPLYWVTGTEDTGSGGEYDALSDAKRGVTAYRAAGAEARLDTPAGVDHSDVAGRIGRLLGDRLDAASAR